MRTRRVALVALAACLVAFALPAAAQAHHVDENASHASCSEVDGVAVVSFTVAFASFGDSEKYIEGTIELDGEVIKTYAAPDFAPVVWNGSAGAFTFTTPVTEAGGYTVAGDFHGPGKTAGNDGDVGAYVSCPAIPGLTLTKTGAAFGYAGDTVEYAFAVENTGNVELELGDIVDAKCADGAVRDADETDTFFDPGEVFNYRCDSLIPADASGTVTNVAQVCAEPVSTETERVAEIAIEEGEKLCATDDHEFPVRSIDIEVDKTAAAATVERGSPAVFTLSVRNTGTTNIADLSMTDPMCAPVRTGDTTDAVLEPGETWTFSCSAATTAQTASPLVNTVTATGRNADGREAMDDGTASVTLTSPPEVLAQSPGPEAPQYGEVLSEAILSGRARLSGPSGCVKRAFRARVTGRSIAAVRFYVDGRLVRTLKGARTSYTLKLKPSSYGFGRHRVEARVTFTDASGTAVRRLPLTFRRCAQGAVAPQFTG